MAAAVGAISAIFTKVGLDFVSSATCHFVCFVEDGAFSAAAVRRGTQYATFEGVALSQATTALKGRPRMRD
jgi:hypothetical protein